MPKSNRPQLQITLESRKILLLFVGALLLVGLFFALGVQVGGAFRAVESSREAPSSLAPPRCPRPSAEGPTEQPEPARPRRASGTAPRSGSRPQPGPRSRSGPDGSAWSHADARPEPGASCGPAAQSGGQTRGFPGPNRPSPSPAAASAPSKVPTPAAPPTPPKTAEAEKPKGRA